MKALAKQYNAYQYIFYSNASAKAYKEISKQHYSSYLNDTEDPNNPTLD